MPNIQRLATIALILPVSTTGNLYMLITEKKITRSLKMLKVYDIIIFHDCFYKFIFQIVNVIFFV